MAAGRAAAALVSALQLTPACGEDPSDLPGGDAETLEAARRHCTDSGGDALAARPEWNTNCDPENWLELAGVAYLSQVPVSLPRQPSSNPATFNCAALGGSAQWGSGVSGGGWVTSDRPTEMVDLCVFPDLSSIDEFGLFYYADGTARGKDLSTVMRYDADPLPGVFG